MYVVGEVEHGRSFRKFQQIAFRREYEHLVFVQIHLELVHKLQAIACFECCSYVVEPIVYARIALDALIAPVRCQTFLGYLVHALGAYLHLHPLLLRTEHGYVQTLVAVRLRHREPVAQTLRVGLVHVGDERVGLPALHLLFAQRRVDDDAYSEEVVDALESALLLLHLLPYRVYALRSAFYMTLYAHGVELLGDRLYKLLYICISRALRLVQLLLYHIVGVVLKILQAEVFQLALQLVEAQLVCQRSIQIARFFGHFLLRFVVLRIADMAHKHHALRYHNQHHAHVLGERKQKVAKVLALYHRRLAV